MTWKRYRRMMTPIGTPRNHIRMGMAHSVSCFGSSTLPPLFNSKAHEVDIGARLQCTSPLGGAAAQEAEAAGDRGDAARRDAAGLQPLRTAGQSRARSLGQPQHTARPRASAAKRTNSGSDRLAYPQRAKSVAVGLRQRGRKWPKESILLVEQRRTLLNRRRGSAAKQPPAAD